MKRLARTLVAVALLCTGVVFATDAEQREENQDRRIDAGVDNGRLNEAEAKRLENAQRRIDSVEEKATADGVVTEKEKHRINKLQNRENKRIHRLKHNRKRG